MPDQSQPIKRIGIVGAGNMGTMMSMGFAEQGIDVSLWDISSSNVDQAIDMAQQEKHIKNQIHGFHDVQEFVKSLDKPDQEQKVFVFSITHGPPADSVLEKIKDELKEGDIILDGGNEDYRRTERRQKEMSERGVHWIGMGVSGGYQSARRGPSMSPGGDRKAVETVLPLLEKFSAKDPKTGKPCAAYIGPGGAGHFVKMVHNGIENGMLSIICEAWSILHKSLSLDHSHIGQIFTKWTSSGELRNTYLLRIGAEILETRKAPEGDKKGEEKGAGEYVLDSVLDKVVQDDDNTEGTGFWTVSEAAIRHVSAPTIASAQYFRVASGNRPQRLKVVEKLRLPQPQKGVKVEDVDEFVETLRRAVYAAILCSFAQGLELIARASADERWDVSLETCMQIWRAGCIIQSEAIADKLQPAFASGAKIMNVKLVDEVARGLRDNYAALKEVVARAVEWDQYVPAMGASLEYVKYEAGEMLATQFMEAEMDYFGAHAYDHPGDTEEDPGRVAKGRHHYEWKPA